MLCSIGPTPKGARQTSGCDAAHVLLRSMVGRWWGARRDECIKHLGSLVKRREGVGAGVVRVWPARLAMQGPQQPAWRPHDERELHGKKSSLIWVGSREGGPRESML